MDVDTRMLIAKIATLRAEKAALFGEEDFSTPPATGPAVDETAV